MHMSMSSKKINDIFLQSGIINPSPYTINQPKPECDHRLIQNQNEIKLDPKTIVKSARMNPMVNHQTPTYSHYYNENKSIINTDQWST